MTSNEDIKLPRLPYWLNLERCKRCRAEYRKFKPGISFSDGTAKMRNMNPDGGGFRSRGPVLWAMWVCKVELWLLHHMECPEVPEVYPDNSP